MMNELLVPFFISNKPFSVKEFAEYHSMNRREAAFVLARFVAQKHLLRIKRGVYLPVSHKGLKPQESFTDPWVVVPEVFPEAYVGGWSAASFWGLTEQLFHRTVILTAKDVYQSRKVLGQYEYILFKAPLSIVIGVESTWRDNQEILISDIHRTVIDMLENPRCGGGIQNTIDCTKVYFTEHYDQNIFINYASQVTKGVFFKRLGYISEHLFGEQHPLCDLARQQMTKGYSSIDTHLKCTKLVTRWNLYINEEISI